MGKPAPRKGSPPWANAIVAGGVATAGAATAYWYHNEHVAVPPKIWVADGPLRDKVLPHLATLLRPYSPTPWAVNRHMQTFLGLLRSASIHNTYSRQLILAPDGGTLGLDWFDGCDARSSPLPPTAPIFLVCHGVNGGSHEGYCKWACKAAAARGWRPVVFNYRGCNGLPFTSARGYSATMTHDLFTAIYSIRARFPGAPVVAVGFSLGGLKLAKYLGEADAGLHLPGPGQPRLWEEGSGLAAAAIVSSPVSLWKSAAQLSDPNSFNFVYNLAVAYKLREHLGEHRREIEEYTDFDVDNALRTWTVQEIEDSGLPSSFGYPSRQHYYEAAGSLQYIPHIATPTLMLLAEDDPFLGVIPDLECSTNPHTLLAVTRHGGHVAFLQGAWPLGFAYMDEAVVEFFANTLQHLHGCDPRVVGEGPGVGRNPAVEQAAAEAAEAAAAGLGRLGERWVPQGATPDAAAAGAAAAAAVGSGEVRGEWGAAEGGACGADGACGGHAHGHAGGQARRPGAHLEVTAERLREEREAVREARELAAREREAREAVRLQHLERQRGERAAQVALLMELQAEQAWHARHVQQEACGGEAGGGGTGAAAREGAGARCGGGGAGQARVPAGAERAGGASGSGGVHAVEAGGAQQASAHLARRPPVSGGAAHDAQQQQQVLQLQPTRSRL